MKRHRTDRILGIYLLNALQTISKRISANVGRSTQIGRKKILNYKSLLVKVSLISHLVELYRVPIVTKWVIMNPRKGVNFGTDIGSMCRRSRPTLKRTQYNLHFFFSSFGCVLFGQTGVYKRITVRPKLRLTKTSHR